MTREQYIRKRRKYIRRRLRLYARRVIFISAVILILFSIGKAVHSLFSKKGSSPVAAVEEIDSGQKIEESVPGTEKMLNNLYSHYMILLERDSGETLAENNAWDKIYPASLTKIMTAVLAVEYTDNMDETVTLSKDFFEQMYAEGASVAGFEPEEKVRLRDLLYGILLPSGGECCLAFAERIAGSEEAFVELMNRKAEEIGMTNTHFCNSTGLQDTEHYSTAEDIARLLQYALNNSMFRQVFTSRSYTTSPSKEHPDGITFYSTMFKAMDNAEVAGGQILGGKTGYTADAGLCLASLAQMGGKEYILVTAKAEGSHLTEPFHILDARNAYNQINIRIILRAAAPHFRLFL